MRRSIRLKEYDYRNDGMYFITMCVKGGKRVMSTIEEGEIALTPYGIVVNDEIQKTECVRPYVLIDEYIIMPDHVHMIICLYGVPSNDGSRARHRLAPTSSVRVQMNSLGDIIGHIKLMCTKRIRQLGLIDFKWQRNYFEHIIRNEKALDRIREYIYANPARWGQDKDSDFLKKLYINT
jgi:putative transposase